MNIQLIAFRMDDIVHLIHGLREDIGDLTGTSIHLDNFAVIFREDREIIANFMKGIFENEKDADSRILELPEDHLNFLKLQLANLCLFIDKVKEINPDFVWFPVAEWYAFLVPADGLLNCNLDAFQKRIPYNDTYVMHLDFPKKFYN